MSSLLCALEEVGQATRCLSGRCAPPAQTDEADTEAESASLESLLSSLPGCAQLGLLRLLHRVHSSLSSSCASLSSLQLAQSSLQSSQAALESELADARDACLGWEKRHWELEMRRRQEAAEGGARERLLRERLQESERRCVMVANRDRQFRHQLRKAETDCEKMADRLQRLMQGRETAATAAAVRLNDSRAKAAQGGSDGLLLQKLAKREEERRHALEQENAALRRCLLQLEQPLSKLTAAADDEAEEEETSATMASEAVLQLPWPVLEKAYSSRVHGLLELLTRTLTEARQQRPRACSLCRQHEESIAALQQLLSSQDTLLLSRLFAVPAPASLSSPLSPATRRLSLEAELAERQQQLSAQQAALTLSITRALHASPPRRQRRQLQQGRQQQADWTPLWSTAPPVCSPSPSPPSTPLWAEDEEGSEGSAGGAGGRRQQARSWQPIVMQPMDEQ